MTFGFSIKNTSGITQIDDTYSNLQVIQRGTISFAGTGIVTVNFATSGRPIIFLRYVSSTYWVQQRYPDNDAEWVSSATFYLHSNTGAPTTGTLSVEYALCKPASDTSPLTGYGLNVFRPDGGLVYSSARSAPNISESLITNLYDSNFNILSATTLSVTTVGTPWFLQTKTYCIRGYQEPTYIFTQSARAISSTQIQTWGGVQHLVIGTALGIETAVGVSTILTADIL